MVWKKTNKIRKKEPTNRLRYKPTISFKSNLSPETLGYIKKLALQKDKSRFMNQALEVAYFRETNKRQFLRNVLQEDYELCRHLLRKIGNENGRKRNQRD